jgi:hypothetical protein
MLRNVAYHFWFCFSFCYIHFEQLSWGPRIFSILFLVVMIDEIGSSCLGLPVVAYYVLRVLPKNLALCPLLIVDDVSILSASAKEFPCANYTRLLFPNDATMVPTTESKIMCP